MLVQFFNRCTEVLRSISFHRKSLSDAITLQAKESLPIRERNFRFMHLQCQYIWLSSTTKACFCSGIMLASIVTVSKYIPRKVREVDGPSTYL